MKYLNLTVLSMLVVSLGCVPEPKNSSRKVQEQVGTSINGGLEAGDLNTQSQGQQTPTQNQGSQQNAGQNVGGQQLPDYLGGVYNAPEQTQFGQQPHTQNQGSQQNAGQNVEGQQLPDYLGGVYNVPEQTQFGQQLPSYNVSNPAQGSVEQQSSEQNEGVLNNNSTVNNSELADTMEQVLSGRTTRDEIKDFHYPAVASCAEYLAWLGYDKSEDKIVKYAVSDSLIQVKKLREMSKVLYDLNLPQKEVLRNGHQTKMYDEFLFDGVSYNPNTSSMISVNGRPQVKVGHGITPSAGVGNPKVFPGGNFQRYREEYKIFNSYFKDTFENKYSVGRYARQAEVLAHLKSGLFTMGNREYLEHLAKVDRSQLVGLDIGRGYGNIGSIAIDALVRHKFVDVVGTKINESGNQQPIYEYNEKFIEDVRGSLSCKLNIKTNMRIYSGDKVFNHPRLKNYGDWIHLYASNHGTALGGRRSEIDVTAGFGIYVRESEIQAFKDFNDSTDSISIDFCGRDQGDYSSNQVMSSRVCSQTDSPDSYLKTITGTGFVITQTNESNSQYGDYTVTFRPKYGVKY